MTTARTTLVLLSACGLLASTGCAKKQEPSAAASANAPAGETHAGFVVTALPTSVGSLAAALELEAGKANGKGLKPFVEFWASWCGPCMELARSLHDPRMEAAFKGTYIIRLNADEWGDKLGGTGFDAKAIPVFYELDAKGKSTGRTIDGGAWEENIPENMAPPLDKYFHGS